MTAAGKLTFPTELGDATGERYDPRHRPGVAIPPRNGDAAGYRTANCVIFQLSIPNKIGDTTGRWTRPRLRRSCRSPTKLRIPQGMPEQAIDRIVVSPLPTSLLRRLVRVLEVESGILTESFHETFFGLHEPVWSHHTIERSHGD